MRVIIAFTPRKSLGCDSKITKMKFYAAYGTQEHYHEILKVVATRRSDMFEFAPTRMWPPVVVPTEFTDEA